MNIVGLAVALAVGAVALFVGAEDDEAAAGFQYAEPFAERGFGVLNVLKQVG